VAYGRGDNCFHRLTNSSLENTLVLFTAECLDKSNVLETGLCWTRGGSALTWLYYNFSVLNSCEMRIE